MTRAPSPVPVAESAIRPDGDRRDGGHLLRLPEQPLLRHLVLMVFGAGLLYLLTQSLSAYNNFQVGEIGAFAIALAGLSVLTGQNGQISLGHGALMAIGAYTVALLMVHTHLNLVVELAIATLVTTAVGVVVGVPAARLGGAYLAGVTLLLALTVPLLAAQYGSIFGGEQGLTTTPPSAPGTINPERWLAWIQLAAALVVMVLLGNLVRSRFGRAFRAVRDDDVAASLAGIHVTRTKVLAFSVSAGCAGLGGALLVLSTGVVNTGEFPLTLSIELLAGMVIGGAGTLVGAWWGAIALVYVPQWSTSLSSRLSLGTTVAAYLADALFGAALIVVILAAPSGIQGSLRRLAHGIAAATTGRASPPNPPAALARLLRSADVPEGTRSSSDASTRSRDRSPDQVATKE